MTDKVEFEVVVGIPVIVPCDVQAAGGAVEVGALGSFGASGLACVVVRAGLVGVAIGPTREGRV